MSDLQSFPIKKHPLAKYPFGLDYSDDLDSDEELSSFVVTAIDLSDGSDAKATILDGDPQIVDGVDVNDNITINARADQIIKATTIETVGKHYKITIVSITTKTRDLPAEIKLDILHGVEE